MTITNQPNPFFNFSAGINFDEYEPPVYGNIKVLKHSENKADILFLPVKPDWAEDERKMIYKMDWNTATLNLNILMMEQGK